MKNLRAFALLEYLRGRKYCSLPELCSHFGVSQATIYRDVAQLEARDLIRRVRGGVASPEKHTEKTELSASAYQERLNWNRAWKEKIAARAFKRIQEGDILFLDSSTTVACLAELLLDSNFGNLTLVTNSVSIIRNFHRFPRHYILLSLGGSYDLQLNAFLGQETLRGLARLSISKAFISAFGLDEEDVTSNHEHHVALLSKVLETAEQRCLLADSSKFKRRGLFKIAPRRMFDEIISEK